MKQKTYLLAGTILMASLIAGCGSSAASSTSASADNQAASASTSSASSEEKETAAVSASKDTSVAASSSAEESVSSESTGASSVSSDMDATGKTIGFVVRAAGNPYIQKEEEGFKEAVEACGGTVIISEPEAATADAQISMITSLISQGVDVIAVGANDTNALSACLQQAMQAGIKVMTIDADVNPSDRQVFVNQAGTEEIGETLAEAVLDISGGEGEYAILSATSQSTNQNAWIEAMQNYMKSDDRFANLTLDEIAYGDDEPQKSTDQTQALLAKYPNLKVICSPTTVGIAAAAKVLQDQGSSVKLTGLGLPSEMAEYIGDDDSHSCPYMFLWNPIDLGKLGGYTAVALADEIITGKEGETFDAPGMENSPYTLTKLDSGDGVQVILGPPYKFDSSNINDWKDVY